jgi:hypothetical protein
MPTCWHSLGPVVDSRGSVVLPSRPYTSPPGGQHVEIISTAEVVHYFHSAWDASLAPSAMAWSLAQTISGSTW